MIGALKHNVEMARGGSGGAPSLDEILAYAGLAYHLGGGGLFRVAIPNLTDCGYLNAQICAQSSDIQSAVSTFTHPDVSLPDRANAVALGRKPKAPKQPKLKRAAITTLVLNGTTIPGFARDTSYKLGQQGFHTVQLPPSGAAERTDAELRLDLRLLRRRAAEREAGRGRSCRSRSARTR